MRSISKNIYLRVTYSDTDQMGFLHHSNYARFYETARWELFRELGIPYCQLEADGYLLPVIDLSSTFHKPAYYDERLKIMTQIQKVSGPRIRFSFAMYNEKDELLNTALITTAFIRKKDKKPCAPPGSVVRALG